MAIQPITNQPNFRGKLVQLDVNRLKIANSKSLKGLPPILEKNTEKSLNELISKEPFDLFIYRFKEYPQFYEITASNNYADILSGEYLKNAGYKRNLIHESSSESSFIKKALDEISAFKEFCSKQIKNVDKT